MKGNLNSPRKKENMTVTISQMNELSCIKVRPYSETNLGKGTTSVVLQSSQEIVLLKMMVLPEQGKYTLCFCT